MGNGSNNYGQLGDGTNTDRNSSVLIDDNVTRVAAGAWSSLYIKDDGSLRGMGSNSVWWFGGWYYYIEIYQF